VSANLPNVDEREIAARLKLRESIDRLKRAPAPNYRNVALGQSLVEDQSRAKQLSLFLAQIILLGGSGELEPPGRVRPVQKLSIQPTDAEL